MGWQSRMVVERSGGDCWGTAVKARLVSDWIVGVRMGSIGLYRVVMDRTGSLGKDGIGQDRIVLAVMDSYGKVRTGSYWQSGIVGDRQCADSTGKDRPGSIG